MTPDSESDLAAEMRPLAELAAEAKGCPDPEFYAGDEGWDISPEEREAEDAEDLADARKALAEEGSIPWERVKAELGPDETEPRP